MKNITGLIFIVFTGSLHAQEYFQQEVNYKIDVRLNDVDNTLSGFEEIEYINNSNSALDKIYMHLWPNAYKNKKTALANQLWDQKDGSLEFAKYVDQGFIDSLEFKVNGEDVKWQYHEEFEDIAIINLNSVLAVGKSVKITTPFLVKIPSGDISRLGHVEESYQITQWYVKPAVFDKNGCNEMPYLTQGEFYSEFGSFDVSITLPKNYIVGATGDLQTESERIFMDSLAESTAEKFEKKSYPGINKENGWMSPFPESSSEMKTIRFTQKNVHDFAWFADKRFQVLKGEVELEGSGRKITSWAMFVPHHYWTWEKSIEYINDGTFYYSKWNGDYPYDQVTALDGTISAGGGMEYPNVTVIGNSASPLELEIVIVHEVGHNWFYGFIGSNERKHAWMDEGLNTMNEIRYMETKYPKNERLSDMFRGISQRIHLEHLSHRDLNDMSYAMSAGYGVDQPIELESEDYSPINYGTIVYSKTGLVFTYLRDYLGDEEFDRIMHVYFDKWHFKHPQPEDLRKIFEDESKKDLSWIFDDLIKTTKQIDHKITKVKVEAEETKVTVKNIGQMDSPVRVDAFSLGQLRETLWAEPGEKKKELTFAGTTFDEFIIDYEKRMPELNRNNNTWHKKGLFKKSEPLKMEFLFGDNERDKTEIWYTPIIGGNVYDKFMVGFLFHNQTIPKNKFEYTLAPMFSVGRLTIAGMADINYTWVPHKNLNGITLGVLGKTFGNGLGFPPDSATEPLGDYYTISPYLRFDLGRPKVKKWYRQTVELKGAYVFETATFYDNTTIGGVLTYNFNWAKRGNYLTVNARLDYANVKQEFFSVPSAVSVLNLGLELNGAITYWKKKGKKIELRAYLGRNLMYSGDTLSRYGFSLGGQSGTMDYMYEHYMFGRNRLTRLWGNQRIENQGGFKTTSGQGLSNTMIIAGNINFQLPYIPAVIYADYGMFDNNGTMEAMWDVGAGLRFGKFFGIYFPFAESANMFPPGTAYANKIRFTITLEGFAPAKLIKSNL